MQYDLARYRPYLSKDERIRHPCKHSRTIDGSLEAFQF